MLCDEAHYLKEPDSTRTRNAFLLSKHIERRFLLTATPVLNRESELHTLLRLSGHPIGAIPLSDFLSDFAGSPELRKALSERVSEWMLRRRKDVLASLKGKRHEFQYVDL
ncbi:SNF2-related protein, partial [Pseudomonas aeruginosa]